MFVESAGGCLVSIGVDDVASTPSSPQAGEGCFNMPFAAATLFDYITASFFCVIELNFVRNCRTKSGFTVRGYN